MNLLSVHKCKWPPPEPVLLAFLYTREKQTQDKPSSVLELGTRLSTWGGISRNTVYMQRALALQLKSLSSICSLFKERCSLSKTIPRFHKIPHEYICSLRREWEGREDQPELKPAPSEDIYFHAFRWEPSMRLGSRTWEYFYQPTKWLPIFSLHANTLERIKLSFLLPPNIVKTYFYTATL